MVAFLIGIILAVFYFGGLYLTVQNMYKVRYPNFLMAISFIFRMGGLIAGFFYISRNGYKDILFTLFGMILTRFIMVYVIKNRKPDFIKRGG